MGRFAVTPGELDAASAALASVEREMRVDNLSGPAGLPAGAVGDAELAGALADLGDQLGRVASAFAGVVTTAGVNVAQAGGNYERVERTTAGAFGMTPW